MANSPLDNFLLLSFISNYIQDPDNIEVLKLKKCFLPVISIHGAYDECG